MMECMTELLAPVNATVGQISTKLNTHVESAKADSVNLHAKLGELNTRLDVVEKKPVEAKPGWAASSGQSGSWSKTYKEAAKEPDDSVKENFADKKEVADKLELRFPYSIEQSQVQLRVAEALASANSSLAMLEATILKTLHKESTERTHVTLQFAKGSRPRTVARNTFAPKDAEGKRNSQLKAQGSTVAAVIPKTRYQIARDNRLFSTRSEIAAVCGMQLEDVEPNTYKHNITIQGTVVARQSISSWNVMVDESALESFLA